MEVEFYSKVIGSAKALSVEQIQKGEEECYGRKFPKSLREFLLRCNGGNFSHCDAEVCFKKGKRLFGIAVEEVCRIEEGHRNNIKRMILDASDVFDWCTNLEFRCQSFMS